MNNEIYGYLTWIGLDAFGNIHLIITKQSWFSIPKILREVKAKFEKEEVKIKIEPLRR